jgi:hypothetical protein
MSNDAGDARISVDLQALPALRLADLGDSAFGCALRRIMASNPDDGPSLTIAAFQDHV